MTDATSLGAHRTTTGLRAKKSGQNISAGVPPGEGTASLTTQAHAATDGKGRALRILMTVGRIGDCTGAAARAGSLPAAEWLITDQGHNADRCRKALEDRAETSVLFGQDIVRRAHPLRQVRTNFPRSRTSRRT
jgi:transposase